MHIRRWESAQCKTNNKTACASKLTYRCFLSTCEVLKCNVTCHRQQQVLKTNFWLRRHPQYVYVPTKSFQTVSTFTSVWSCFFHRLEGWNDCYFRFPLRETHGRWWCHVIWTLRSHVRFSLQHQFNLNQLKHWIPIAITMMDAVKIVKNNNLLSWQNSRLLCPSVLWLQHRTCMSWLFKFIPSYGTNNFGYTERFLALRGGSWATQL